MRRSFAGPEQGWRRNSVPTASLCSFLWGIRRLELERYPEPGLIQTLYVSDPSSVSPRTQKPAVVGSSSGTAGWSHTEWHNVGDGAWQRVRCVQARNKEQYYSNSFKKSSKSAASIPSNSVPEFTRDRRELSGIKHGVSVSLKGISFNRFICGRRPAQPREQGVRWWPTSDWIC